MLGANKVTSNFSYYPWNTPNGAGRLQTASHSNSSQTLQAFNYTYSSVGNILSLTITDPKYNEAHAYGYDPLSRLTSAVVSGGPANYSESYGYNATTGNLQTKGGQTLAYNDPNHVHAVTNTGGNPYGYDANGNQTTRVIGGSTFTLSYDAENRLVSVSGPSLSAQFTYDGDGRRVKSVINGVTTNFVGNHYEVTGGVATKYYFAGGSRVAMRQNGTLYYLLSDHLGSTSLTTDANGVKIAGLRYNAWGAVRYADGTTPTKYTYTGQYSYMGEFGLMFFNARWLDPALGRFAQADMIVPGASQGTQAWDRYAGMNNNPIKYNDPSGHMVDDGSDGGCALLDCLNDRQKEEREKREENPINKRGFTFPQKVGKGINFLTVEIIAGFSEYSLFKLQQVLIEAGPLGIVIDLLLVPIEFVIADFSVSFGLMTYHEVVFSEDVNFDWVLSNAIADTLPPPIHDQLVEILPGVFH